jgi:hypothetical protein
LLLLLLQDSSSVLTISLKAKRKQRQEQHVVYLTLRSACLSASITYISLELHNDDWAAADTQADE